MSGDQLTELISKIKDDQGLVEKLKTAQDLDSALLITKEAGFNITKADWLRYQANRTLELSDEELENVSGGTGPSGAGCGTDGDMCLY
jgi:predicted ribosomally synthesized peptide with nif11-like leader